MSAEASARAPNVSPWGGGGRSGSAMPVAVRSTATQPTPIASPDRRIFELARKLADAKHAEDLATRVRVALEEEIAAVHNFDREDGQETIKVEGDYGRAKLVLKQNVYRKVDEDKIPEVKRALGKQFGDVFRIKHDLSVSGLKALEKADRDLFLVASGAVQKTPGKVSVQVQEFVEGGGS